MRRDERPDRPRPSARLEGAFLAVLCLLLVVSTYDLWRREDPSREDPSRPPGPSGPRSWSRLELRLDRGWRARAAGADASAAVTLPDLGSMARPRARVTYTNRFRLPASLAQAARARLRVEGAVCRTRVVLNGKTLGQWRYPGLPFEVDATAALDRRGQNLLELVVDDRDGLNLSTVFRPEPPAGPGSLPSANAFSSWRRAHLKGPVTLVLTGDPFIAAATISPSWRKQRLMVEVALQNKADSQRVVHLQARLYFGQRSVALQKGRHLLSPGRSTRKLVIPVRAPAAWGMPPHGKSQRYTLVLSLTGPDQSLDQVVYDVGFRESWATRAGLKLNGKALFLLARAATPDLGGDVPLERLLLASEDAGYNAWHVHFNSVRRELFELCDELGVYLIPSLICIGPLQQHQNPDAERFLRLYIERWLRTFHNHPSVVIWGQELMHHWFPPGHPRGLDRPAVDVDLRGLYGTMEALAQFKARRKSGETGGVPPRVGDSPPAPTGLAMIHEIHRSRSLDAVPALLRGFPKLAGCILMPLDHDPSKRAPLESVFAHTPGLSRARLAAGVLPLVRVSARRNLCLLHQPYRLAPRYLGGSLMGRGSPARVRAREEGALELWVLDSQKLQRRTVQVKKGPLARGRRPVMELGL